MPPPRPTCGRDTQAERLAIQMKWRRYQALHAKHEAKKQRLDAKKQRKAQHEAEKKVRT